MPNVYFTHGTKNEQYLLEDLIIESISIWGQEFLYIPRSLVAKDDILGEDRLSKFENAYPIDMYLENVQGFEGQGAFIEKFGLMMQQSATLTVARRTWERLVGKHTNILLPNRPSEGDLLYYPLTKGLFEIKFVEHQDPFYQLRKLYVYRLQVELFQYASEKMDTGVEEIDAFESLKTYNTDTTINPHGEVVSIAITNQGLNYTSIPTVVFTSTSGFGVTAIAVRGTGSTANKIIAVNITSPGTGYKTAPIITFIGGGGSNAAAICQIKVNIDDTLDSYGNNNVFKKEVESVINFDETNPFGEIAR